MFVSLNDKEVEKKKNLFNNPSSAVKFGKVRRGRFMNNDCKAAHVDISSAITSKVGKWQLQPGFLYCLFIIECFVSEVSGASSIRLPALSPFALQVFAQSF